MDATGTNVPVRGGHLPRRALWIVVALGAIAARILLAGGATHATLAAGAAIEGCVLVVIGIRIRRARRGWRQARLAGAPRIDALYEALAATGLPKGVTGVIATELAIVGSAVTGWRRPRRDAARFTVHRTNGWPLYVGVFAALAAVETPALHLVLVAFHHPTVAWIATATSLYSIVWLIGDAHALRHGGVIVTADRVILRLGIRWRGAIARDAIVNIESVTAAPADAVDASILGANVVLHLRTPVELRGLSASLRRRRAGCTLALSIDDRERFVAALALK